MNIAAQAYEIFTSHLLSEICDESKNLCRENETLQPLRDFLNDVNVELVTGAFNVVVDELAKSKIDKGFIVESSDDFQQRIIIPFECEPRPLASFGGENSVRIKISNQSAGIFSAILDHVVLVVLEEENSILLALPISSNAFIEGKITGLSPEDFRRIKNKTCGENEIMEYLRTGNGLESPNILFTPSSVDIVLDKPLLQTYGLLQSDFSDEFAHQTFDSEMRAAAISLYRAASKMQMLRNHRVLKSENIILSKIRSKISAIEVDYDSAKIQFSFDDGHVGEDSYGVPVWVISLPDVSISFDEINTLALHVSGIDKDRLGMRLSVIDYATPSSGLFGEICFDDGFCLCGFFYSDRFPSRDEVETVRNQIVFGNLSFLKELNFVFIPCALLCNISSVEHVLNSLGIQHDNKAGNNSPTV
mmetsp:Transcript_14659/g.30710  ORF Transcript_14659/g.30710 Transcript_14659/m.30710 type:complete len:418 (+) Transcript_14659:619-1872(+)